MLKFGMNLVVNKIMLTFAPAKEITVVIALSK